MKQNTSAGKDSDASSHRIANIIKAKKVARCGNAVCPPIPTALVRANLPELCKIAGNAEEAA